MIKAIETRYKGYKFRSRLEARWAVFFDAINVKYKYEEYGFEKEGHKWLPDFYLPDTATWVEVKGGNITEKDSEKMLAILDYGSPLPFFDDSKHTKNFNERDFETYKKMGGNYGQNETFKCARGLLLLNDIPDVQHGITLHPFISHYKGLHMSVASFLGKKENCNLCALSEDHIEMLSFFSKIKIPEGLVFNHANFSNVKEIFISSYFAYSDVCKAYQKARAARFEHGECG